MELGISCLFQILNTRTRSGPDINPKNYRYFNYRPEPTRTREEPTRPKISKYLLGRTRKVPDPKRTGPNPTRRPERSDLILSPCVLLLGWIMILSFVQVEKTNKTLVYIFHEIIEWADIKIVDNIKHILILHNISVMLSC